MKSPVGRSTLAGLIAASLAAVALRSLPATDVVFRDGLMRPQTPDASYHMRLVENQVANYPRLLEFDPLAAFPQGEAQLPAPAFPTLVSTLAVVLGAGEPGPRLVERVAAWTPPLLGGLTVAVVGALGVTLFGPAVGLVAAGLLAVAANPFFDRTRLGYVDHHALEALLAPLVILLLARAIRAAQAGDAGAARASADRYSSAAGVALSAYLLTWTSGAYLVAALVAWAAVEALLAAARREPPRATRALAPALLVAGALLLAQPSRHSRFGMQLAALAGGLVALGVLEAARQGARRHRKATLWLLGLGGILVIVATTLGRDAAAVRSLLTDLGRFAPGPAARLVAEARPLLWTGETWSPWPAWLEFRLALPVGLAGLALLGGRLARREAGAGALLLLVWTLANLLATLGQVRFGYYLAPCLALLGGLACAAAGGRSARDARQRQLAVLALAGLIASFEIPVAWARAGRDEGPGREWDEALAWLREGTPPPFGTDAYAWSFALPPPGTAYTPPATAYGVAAWWDYGYWILREARRIPIANPTQKNAREVAQAFLETDPRLAREELERLGARYVVTHFEQTQFEWPPGSGLVRGKLAAMALWAGQPAERFVETFLERRPGGGFTPRLVYHPDYYRSLFGRLYLYAGAAATPENTSWVVRFAPREEDGRRFNELIETRRFATYEEARAYLAANEGSGGLRLVGLGPTRTCVPLEPLEGLTPVFDTRADGWFARYPAIRVFAVGEARGWSSER